MEAVRISQFSRIYVQNALGVYVRNLIEKIPQPFIPGRTYSQATEEMKKCNAMQATVAAGNRAKSAGTLVSFVPQKRRTLSLRCGCTFAILCLVCGVVALG